MLESALTKLYGAFSGGNEATWFGHGLQGLVFGFGLGFEPGFAVSFTLGAFLHREVSDFVTPIAEGRMSLRDSARNVKEDGLLDLATPFIGLVLGLFLHAIVFGR